MLGSFDTWDYTLTSPEIGTVKSEFIISNLVPQSEWDALTESDQQQRLDQILAVWVDQQLDRGIECTEMKTKKKKVKVKHVKRTTV